MYVYLLLEFQSGVDRYMAVRLLGYIALLYQDLIRTGLLPADGRLPPVLPVVLYNGGNRWTAPVTVEQLIAPVPGALRAYQPRLRYLPVDEGRYAESELAAQRNLAAALFRLENSRGPDDIRRVLRGLIQWLDTPELAGLRRAFAVWLGRVLLPSRVSGIRIPEFNDLLEVDSMLAERVKEWTRQWKEEGLEEDRRQGWEEGWAKGLAEGRDLALAAERALLLRQARRRFGDDCTTRLQPLLDNIHDQERLAEVGEWIVACAAVDELIALLKNN